MAQLRAGSYTISVELKNGKTEAFTPVSYTHLVENLRDWNSLKSAIKGDVSDYLFKKTKRSPMVLPIIMEI